MYVERTLTVPRPIETVFAYLGDFTHTNEWDPGTVETTLVSGDGDVGTTYRNVSRFLGRESTLAYTVLEHEAPHRVALQGVNATVEALDTMEIRADGAGTRVTYTADFTFKGVARLVAPLLRPALTRLGDEAEVGLTQALGRLASES